MARLDGWEGRLNALIEDARKRPYVLGEHDCLRVACAAVQALTGADPWPEWAGRYSTKREALVVIARYAGGGLDDAVTKFLDQAPVAPRLARRGDLVLYVDAAGEAHLGVSVGSRAAVLGADGLAFVRLGECRQAWRIG